MNRRGFLSAIAGLVAGATLDPERRLWRAGAKLISIPAPRLTIPDDSMTLRFVRNYDVSLEAYVTRIDVLMGWGKCWPPAEQFFNLTRRAG